MKGETAAEAMQRAHTVAGWRAAEDEARTQDRLRGQDRMVVQRIIARDENGNPRRLEAECAKSALAEVVHGGGDRWLRTADQLEPGHFVRVAGEFYRFDGLLPDGRMRLMVGDREFHYGPTGEGEHAERFVWAEAEPF